MMAVSNSVMIDIVVQGLELAPPYFTPMIQHFAFDARPKMWSQVFLRSKPPIAHFNPLQSSFKVAINSGPMIELSTFWRISLQRRLNLCYGYCLLTPSRLACAQICCDGKV